VKRAFKYFGILLFVTVYCFAISSVSASHVYSVNGHSHSEKHVLSVSADVFSGFVSSFKSVSPSQNFPNPNLKHSFDGIRILEKIYKVVFQSKYTQYVGFAKNLLIRNRKTDIIFPFHYFW
jgi:hypothetical protein